MDTSHVVLIFLGVVGTAAIIFEIYRYIKGHPQALTDLEARLTKVEATAKVDWQGLVTAVDRVRDEVRALAGKVAPVATPVAQPPAASQPPTTQPPTTQPPTQSQPVATPPAASPPAQPAPVHDGFALVANDRPLRNTVVADGRDIYTLTVAGMRTQQIMVFGAPGSFFHNMTYSVVNRAGVVVVSQTTQQVAGSTGGTINLTLPDDSYMLLLQVDGAGVLGVQYLAWA